MLLKLNGTTQVFGTHTQYMSINSASVFYQHFLNFSIKSQWDAFQDLMAWLSILFRYIWHLIRNKNCSEKPWNPLFSVAQPRPTEETDNSIKTHMSLTNHLIQCSQWYLRLNYSNLSHEGSILSLLKIACDKKKVYKLSNPLLDKGQSYEKLDQLINGELGSYYRFLFLLSIDAWQIRDNLYFLKFSWSAYYPGKKKETLWYQ